LIGKLHLLDIPKTKQYLLKLTQHSIGGFGKYPGDPPDIYHSYFGLAALALLEHEDLKPIHPAACISMDTFEHMQRIATDNQGSSSNLK
jgi:geranylgeranyl transferase type-1 subunit beta